MGVCPERGHRDRCLGRCSDELLCPPAVAAMLAPTFRNFPDNACGYHSSYSQTNSANTRVVGQYCIGIHHIRKHSTDMDMRVQAIEDSKQWEKSQRLAALLRHTDSLAATTYATCKGSRPVKSRLSQTYQSSLCADPSHGDPRSAAGHDGHESSSAAPNRHATSSRHRWRGFASSCRRQCPAACSGTIVGS